MNTLKRVAITGATGMIGANLIQKLIQENISVVAIVRPNSSKRFHIPDHALIEVIECPIDGLVSLGQTEKPCDVFFHFAWDGTFGDSRNNGYLQTKNVEYTLDAVKLAHAWGCHTFIGAGSQAEYGRVDGILSPNTPVNPENGYGIAKYTAGKLSAIYAAQLGMRHIWTRILSVYGPMDNDFTMVMTTIRRLCENEKTEFTAGDQIWDYLYAGDAANAFYLIAKKGKDQSLYCIGSGQAHALKEYIGQMRDAVDPSLVLGLGLVPYAKGQVMHLCADIGNLTQDTGFTPQVSFEDGIKYTVKWYKEQIKLEKN